MALPTYLRKKQELELDEEDNFYDQAFKNTVLQGSPDISEFLITVQTRAADIKRKKEEAEAKAREEADDSKLKKKRE